MSRIQKILFVSLSNIGDAVLTLPVLEALKNRYPDAHIDLVVGIRAEVVFAEERRIRLTFVTQSHSWAARAVLFYRLWREHYDLVVDLRKTYFSFLGREGNRLWHPVKGKHKRDRHFSNLERFGFGTRTGGIGTFIRTDETKRLVDDKLKTINIHGKEPLIVIAAGARSDLKQWTKEGFAELADRLIETSKAHVIWIGDAKEKERVKLIAGSMRNPSRVFCGQTDWNQLVELIDRADLVVTNDSAPLHIADHLRKKIVSIFGPTNPEKYGPQHSEAGVVFKGIFCSPCEKAQCRFNHECMTQISVDEVYKKALGLLRDSHAGAKERLLVMRLDRLGDVLLTLPALEAIKKSKPHVDITALVRPYTKDVVERSEAVNRVRVYDYRQGGAHASLRGYVRLVREIRRMKFDQVIIFHPTLRSHLLAFLAGIPRRIGYATRGACLLTHQIRDERHTGLKHEREYTADLCRLYGVPVAKTGYRIQVFAGDVLMCQKRLRENGLSEKEPIVLIHPGASSPSKKWPIEHFAELIRQIYTLIGYRCVLVGDLSDESDCRAIVSLTKGCSVNMSGQTSIPLLAAMSQYARLLVSNDSGPGHIAAGVGTPVITLFGRHQAGLGPRRWRPLGAENYALHRDVGCVVCMADECPIKFECIKSITPYEVMGYVAKVLKKTSIRNPRYGASLAFEAA